MARNTMTGCRRASKASAKRQHSQVSSCAMVSPENVAPASSDQAYASAAPAWARPCLRASATVRLSSQAANKRPFEVKASTGKRWLAGSEDKDLGAPKPGPSFAQIDADLAIQTCAS